LASTRHTTPRPVITPRLSPDVPRLLDVLAARYPGASKHTLRQWLVDERVTVHGRTVLRGDAEVPDDARVLLVGKAQPTTALDAVRVVFEDRHLLVIDKPPGLLSVATRKDGRTSASAAVRKYLARAHAEPFLVHRLDEVASGLLMFAKTEAVQQALHGIFARHDLERLYLAVVQGQPRIGAGVITTRLIESDRRPFKVRSLRAADPAALGAHAERACTRWRVLARAVDRAALLVRLETGKKHQIRVHLSELGCPIVGDRLYGGPPFRRLLLHAARLRFRHPVTGASVVAVSRPEPAFRRAVAGLPDPLPDF